MLKWPSKTREDCKFSYILCRKWHLPHLYRKLFHSPHKPWWNWTAQFICWVIWWSTWDRIPQQVYMLSAIILYWMVHSLRFWRSILECVNLSVCMKVVSLLSVKQKGHWGHIQVWSIPSRLRASNGHCSTKSCRQNTYLQFIMVQVSCMTCELQYNG